MNSGQIYLVWSDTEAFNLTTGKHITENFNFSPNAPIRSFILLEEEVTLTNRLS